MWFCCQLNFCRVFFSKRRNWTWEQKHLVISSCQLFFSFAILKLMWTFSKKSSACVHDVIYSWWSNLKLDNLKRVSPIVCHIRKEKKFHHFYTRDLEASLLRNFQCQCPFSTCVTHLERLACVYAKSRETNNFFSLPRHCRQ